MVFREVEHKWYIALMKLLTKASRINNALQVIQYMNSNLTNVVASRV